MSPARRSPIHISTYPRAFAVDANCGNMPFPKSVHETRSKSSRNNDYLLDLQQSEQLDGARKEPNMAIGLSVLCVLLLVGFGCSRLRAKADPKKDVQKLFS